ncbi:MAG: SIR2 family protein [Promethearchaeota archaeon]
MEDRLKILDESLSYFFNKKVVLFIGSGISKIAGCYDWNTIIRELLNDDCLFKDLNPDIFIKSNKQNNEKIQFIEKRYRKAKKDNKFWGILREAITPYPKIYVKKYIPFIESLKNIYPFPIILTTNIDSCLEDSKEFDQKKVYYEINKFKKKFLKEGSIFHIHGYREEFLSALFTKEKYIERYESTAFRDFIKYIFSDYCVVFIGYSFNDNELRQLILNARNGRNDSKHYLLVPENEFSMEDIAINQELYNIYTIEYGDVDNFPEIFSSWIAKNFKVEPIGSVKSFSTSSGRSVK